MLSTGPFYHGTFPYLGFTIIFLIVTSQEDERQASEDGVLRVLPQLDHDTELREAQLAWLPEDHEEVRQEPQLQGQLQYILQVASIFSTIHLKIFRKGPNGKMKPSLHLN